VEGQQLRTGTVTQTRLLGSVRWSTEVLERTARLREEVEALREDPDAPAGAAEWLARVERHVARAQEIARGLRWKLVWSARPFAPRDAEPAGDETQPAEVVGDQVPVERQLTSRWRRWWRVGEWWTGSAVEMAWSELHRAEEDLILARPADALRAEAVVFRELANAEPDDNERKRLLEGIYRALESNPRGELSRQDRRILADVTRRAHLASDAGHRTVRQWRNFTFSLAAVLGALTVALWIAGLAKGEVIGLGAAAGALTIAFSQRPDARLEGPYSSTLAQLFLKLAAGALTAALAVKLLTNGAFGVLASSKKSDPAFYAIVFGFSQQAFTRLVDQQLSTVGQQTVPRAPRSQETRRPAASR
jgi:hypothetical protein